MAVNALQWRDLMLQRMQQAEIFQRQQEIMQLMQIQQEEEEEDDDTCSEELRTLFIANLDDTKVDEELLYELFLQAGPIEKVSFPKKKTFAFITYVHKCTPSYAMHLYQGTKLYGQPLVIKFKGTTNLPPLLRRLLPPHYGMAMQQSHNPFSEPTRPSQQRCLDNSALRNSRLAAFMDVGGVGNHDRNYRRDRSPQRHSRDRNNDNHRRNDRSSPTRRCHEKDFEKNWTHGPDRARSRSNHGNRPYDKRRF